jgi:glycosyltransferase involved in cell wall biosynthesis
VYVSDLFACPAGVLVSLIPWVKVAYHEHDWPTAGRNVFGWLCLASRRWLASRAELCILPNKRRADRFVKDVADRDIHCVWNCPTLDEVGPARPPATIQRLALLFHGAITPPQIPTTVLEAVAQLPETVTLALAGYETLGSIGYVRQLQDEANRLGISRRVTFEPAMPRRELLERCRCGDVGLALVPKVGDAINDLGMVGASNKTFDYLASGLALLVSDDPEWYQTYVKAGYGLACDPDSAQSIAAAVCWFLDHPDEVRGMGERGRQRIRLDWNYERQFATVFQRLSSKRTGLRTARRMPW